ncbi:hypothetical protein [Pedosphaera parvula]|uniref:Uncharacterized protein n=1 Tax=Pedosphaera parvula (strain Ellin514) TaxID=320771 RepID=B9XL79_PEDPL|nr:hypothetical protein [Pedosphaera parvula]EEF59430.1 hypothetical protein Cflav_PD2274 [Pedosphaera parvula Ellin514]
MAHQKNASNHIVVIVLTNGGISADFRNIIGPIRRPMLGAEKISPGWFNSVNLTSEYVAGLTTAEACLFRSAPAATRSGKERVPGFDSPTRAEVTASVSRESPGTQNLSGVLAPTLKELTLLLYDLREHQQLI